MSKSNKFSTIDRELSEHLISPFTKTSILWDSESDRAQQESRDCFQPQALIPECYQLRKPFEATQSFLKKASDKVLFYIFYNLAFEK